MNFTSSYDPPIQSCASSIFPTLHSSQRVWEALAAYSVPFQWAHVQTNKLHLVCNSVKTKENKYKLFFFNL